MRACVLILFAGLTVIATATLGAGTAQADVHCSTCRYVGHFVHGHVDHPDAASEERLGQVLAHACSALPASHRNGCTTLVEHHGSHMIQALTSGVPPHELCGRIGVCESGDHARCEA